MNHDHAILASLLSVVLVSLLSLVGLVALPMGEARLRSLATFFISFGVGALLGDAFIHLIPEIFGKCESHGVQFVGSLGVLGGILLFFVIEKLLRRKHGVLGAYLHSKPALARPGLAAINLLGDGIHNFIDGVLIGASYLVSIPLGLSTTLAVVLHEIPHELSDFAIYVHSGLSIRKAVLLNLVSAGAAILGTIAVLAVGSFAGRASTSSLLPIAAGGFIYLAAADLIPELQRDRSLPASLLQTVLIVFGIAVMCALLLVE